MTADRRTSQFEDGLGDDPLLDACLDEVLGGHAPPDLTERILQAVNHRRTASMTELTPPPLYPAAETPRPLRRAPLSPSWNVALAASLLLAVALGAALLSRHQQSSPTNLAPTVTRNTPRPPSKRGGDASAPRQAEKSSSEGLLASDAANPQTSLPPGPTPSKEATPAQVAENTPDGSDDASPFTQEPREALPAPAPSSYAEDKPRPEFDADIIAFVNRTLQQAWRENGVTASPPATDGEWGRRAYLRMIGRTPTYEELAAFVANPSSNKKEELVNQLLYEDDYVEQYARHWSGVWTNLLIGRTGGASDDDLANRDGLEQYLRRSFQFNKPYDQIAFELVSATGANRPGSEGFNGAVNFLLANYTHDFALATSKTARVFLGKQLHCAQCHNHPFEAWTQDDFWGLNAFFRQTHIIRDADKVRLANRDFPGETGDTAQAEIYFDRLNGLRKVAYPRWLDGTVIDPHGQVARVDRRRALATFLADSPDFSRAMVNRLWAHFLGYGFVEPVDDMRPSNPASHPELLDYLSGQFAAHNYDVKRLLRWIALNDAFGASSRITPKNLADAPDQGVTPLFSRYYTRQMRAEEVYESLALLAADGRRDNSIYADLQAAKPQWLSQFTQDLETDEGDEANTFNGAIPQSLAMMNGELIHATLTSEQGFLNRLARSDLKPAEKLNRLFLAAVARPPTRREIEAANQLLAAHQGNLAAALQDLAWALLNSNEFILDH